ncbi:MAG: hypothetical protein AB9866_19925 [Syntrophobacteraceae bacterium]
MLLKVNGCELEIVEDKFVCYATNDGDTNHFCEWNYLDPNLQERFKALRLGLLEVMQEFALSNTMIYFQSVAEEYNADSNDLLPMICLKKPLNNTL